MTIPVPAGGDDGPEPGATQPKKRDPWKRNAIEWVVVIAGAVAVALIIQATSFQAFYIPSQSMESTLHVGDRVLVNKWSYRLHPIHRGDIVVFSKPKGELASNINDLIKRVIALPGESVTIANNHVYINGHQLDRALPAGRGRHDRAPGSFRVHARRSRARSRRARSG